MNSDMGDQGKRGTWDDPGLLTVWTLIVRGCFVQSIADFFTVTTETNFYGIECSKSS